METLTTASGTLYDHKDGKYLWDLEHPEGYGNRIGRYRTDQEIAFVAKHLGPKPLRVIDVGGGSGRLAALYQSLGHKVTLVDRNPLAVKMAEKRGLDRTAVSDIMKFEAGDFDAAACMEVIEYFKDCRPVIKKCAEFVKPGGKVFFCIINRQSWRFKLRTLKRDEFDVNAYTPREIDEAATEAGLEIIDRRGFQWCLAPTGSDSRLVTVSAGLEKMLGLAHWIGQSPWILYAARKGVSRLAAILTNLGAAVVTYTCA